ncbi:MAG TPA: zf-HC2 domain-containing protein [Gemmatimonadales bacterium]|nr:zf-HC2 domain-containing protein [Gemmatimonadales bacterium]
MKDQWTDRLSEYLDGDLTPAERTTLEAHLAACGTCRTTLDELRRVVARAQALDDRPPAADLWPGIAEHIGVVSLSARREGGARRRLSVTMPQLAAAAVVLVLFSAGSVWLALRNQPTPPPTPLAPGTTAAMSSVGMSPLDARTAASVAALEQTLARNRSRLDTGTVRVIQKNLAIIDRAIRDAQSALAADPANAYLNQHLAKETRRKLELLRQAATLATARS